jgi:hypothetical protein
VAEGKYDDQITAMQVQITQLQRENQKMQTALAEVANANVLPAVLHQGFENVIAELRPLRDLTPQRGSVKEEIAIAACVTIEAMKGVTLTGDSLAIPPFNVPFIGEPRPDVKPPASCVEPQPYPDQPDPYKPDPYKPDPYKTDPYKTHPHETPDQPIQPQLHRKGYRP